MSKKFYFKHFSVALVHRLIFKTVLFQAIQFSISTNWPTDRNLSGTITPSQSEPGSNGNNGELRIPQSSSITRTSPSDCLVPYPRHSLGRGSYPSAEKQPVYSTPLAEWAMAISFISQNPKETYVFHFQGLLCAYLLFW